MNHDYIEQNHIIDRYLKGSLTAAEADRFADHSIGCHQCIHQLEMAERMQRGLEKAFADNVTAPDSLEKRHNRRWPTTLGSGAGLLALAAAVLLGFFGLWQWLQKDEIHNQLIQARSQMSRLEQEQVALQARLDRLEQPSQKLRGPLVNLPVVRLQPMRSASPGNRLPGYEVFLSKQVPLIVFSLQSQGNEVNTFEAQLINQENVLVWNEKSLAVDVHGQVVFGLPTEMISAGVFKIKLFGNRSEKEKFLAGLYEFSAVTE